MVSRLVQKVVECPTLVRVDSESEFGSAASMTYQLLGHAFDVSTSEVTWFSHGIQFHHPTTKPIASS